MIIAIRKKKKLGRLTYQKKKKKKLGHLAVHTETVITYANTSLSHTLPLSQNVIPFSNFKMFQKGCPKIDVQLDNSFLIGKLHMQLVGFEP